MPTKHAEAGLPAVSRTRAGRVRGTSERPRARSAFGRAVRPAVLRAVAGAPTSPTTVPPAAAPEPVAPVLEAAGLRYTVIGGPGIRRIGRAGRFRYVDARGKPIDDEATLDRIRKLVLPPAWSEVWICASPYGHLQAMGRDARGRKQYRYHEEWRARRDQTKFHRLAAFGRALPAIRRAVRRDLALPGMPREKVLAAMVSLLDRTFVRVGADRYRKENGSYGLTTLRNRHVEVRGDRIRIRFRGKGGKEHDIALEDARLARVLRRCLDLPGYELFQYMDGEEPRTIDATDVNEYIQSIAGDDYTAKDFRTWGGTLIATMELGRMPPPSSKTEATRNVNAALRTAASVLGNTLAVCRKSYVHPGVVDSYREGRMGVTQGAAPTGLRAVERRALALLTALARAEKSCSDRRAGRRAREAGRPSAAP
jgi:DNA topoisomerase-1